jgi:hypothetical protein
MIRKLLITGLVAVGLFVLLEFSYRFYFIGLPALNPFAVNSYTTLMGSRHVKPSEFPSVYYELKPNLDVLLRGVPLRTNSHGLADREYSLKKPANTYRIALLGSSWTMPASVAPETAYQFVLEEQLNARSTGVSYEVINFGVEQYGLGEMIGTLEHRVLAYEPDMVILATTPFTVMIKWFDRQTSFQPQADSAPIFESMVLLQLGITKSPAQNNIEPDVINKEYPGWEALFNAQLPAALYRAKKICDANDIDFVFMFLWWQTWMAATEARITDVLEKLQIPMVDVSSALGDGITNYKVSEVDKHPNALAHGVIAAELMKYLENQLELKPN